MATNNFNPLQYGATPVSEPEPGIFKSLVQETAKPFLKTGLTAFKAGQGLTAIARGDVEQLRKATDVSPKRFGFLGEAKPVETIPEAIGTGTQIGLEVAGGELTKLIPTGVKTGLARLGERTAKKTFDKIVQVVSPKLTAKEVAEEATKVGVKKSGLLGRITLNVSKATKEIAETVQKHVPGFNPSKTIGENLNITKSALTKEAETLKNQIIKSGKDKIYSFKELGAKMNSVVKPFAIKSDAILERQFDLAKEAALKIARQKGGKISNLLDARKAFDDLVEKEFPNLYDRANAPMRNAITSMRDVMNDFVANNVKDVAFKDSLKVQRQLFRAIDNMADKIASGVEKEIGTTALRRFGQRHPIVKKAAGYVGAGAVGTVLGGRILGE